MTKECPQCHAQCPEDQELCEKCGCPLNISDLDISEPIGRNDTFELRQNPDGAEIKADTPSEGTPAHASVSMKLLQRQLKGSYYEEHPTWKSLRPWRGRMGRDTYLYFCLALPLIFLGFVGILGPIMGIFMTHFKGQLLKSQLLHFSIIGNMFWLFLVYLVFLKWAADVRRLHDSGLSGLWVLIFRVVELLFVPLWLVLGLSWFTWVIIGIFLLDFLIFEYANGTSGPNKYGPDPDSKKQTGDMISAAQKVRKLKELKKMKDTGLIAESEYEEMRAKIVSSNESISSAKNNCP